MRDMDLINRYRLRAPTRHIPEIYCTDESAGFNGLFRITIDGKLVRCIVSDGEDWDHVSVSIEGESKPPSWDIMCKVKDIFFDEEDWVSQFHPARSDYVNHHPGCLHLWKYTGGLPKTPHPPSTMVGIKKKYAGA